MFVCDELKGEREKVFQGIDAKEALIINALTAASNSSGNTVDDTSV